MAISTNPKPAIYRNLYENMDPVLRNLHFQRLEFVNPTTSSDYKLFEFVKFKSNDYRGIETYALFISTT